MGLANIKTTVADGALGASAGNLAGIFGFVGIAEQASNGIVVLGSADDLKKLAEGELKETLRDVYKVSSPRIYALAIRASTNSSLSQPDIKKDGVWTVAVSGTANNRYLVSGKIAKDGRLGTAKVSITINGIEQKSLVIPADGVLVLDGTGLTLTFTNGNAAADSVAFVSGDTFSFTSTLPTVTNQELITAVEQLIASKLELEGIVVATETAKGFWAMLAETAKTCFTKFQYLVFITKAVQQLANETNDAYVQKLIGAERGGVDSYRVAVCAGDFLAGESGVKKSILGKYVGTVCDRNIQDAPDAVKFGNVAGEDALSIKEDSLIELLEESGFVTARTIIGLKGVYITSGRMLCEQTSDYAALERIRVMNSACRAVRKAQLTYLNNNVELGADGSMVGIAMFKKLSEIPLEQMIRDKVISDAEVIIPDGQNILADATVRTKIRIVPLGKMKFIENEISYKNPLLGDK